MIGGLEKPGIYFCLNSLFLTFEVFQMALWLITSLFNDLDPQKIEVSKLMRDIMNFCYLKTILKVSNLFFFFFFTYYTAQTQKIFSIFLLNTLSKLSEK